MKNKKIKRKLLATTLALTMLASNLPHTTLYASSTGESITQANTSLENINAVNSVTYNTWADVAKDAVAGIDYTVDTSTSSMQIHTAKGLAWFANQVNTGNSFSGETVTLENNIDLTEAKVVGYSSTGTITAENSWQAIGNENNKFSGTFDGNGKTISAVYINSDEQQYQGLFGYVEGNYGRGGTIKNLGVVNSNITSTYDSEGATGGIVGRISGICSLEKCYFKGEVNGTKNVGSIIGMVDKISEYNLGEITVTQCYNTGVVRGTENTGGIIGNINSLANVNNCYNTGLVTKPLNYSGATSKHAGIVGRASNNSIIINNCYNIGEIQGNEDNEFGIACIDENANAIEVINCYYNTETSGIVKKTDDGLTTAQMTGIVNGTDKYNDNKMNFDSNIWTFTANTFNSTTNEITYNYPVLTNNKEVPTPTITKKESKITLKDNLSMFCGETLSPTDQYTVTGRDTNTENNVIFTFYSDEALTKKVEDISQSKVGIYYVVAHLEATNLYTQATSNTATLEIKYADVEEGSYTITTADEKDLIINEQGALVYKEDTTKNWITSTIIIKANSNYSLRQTPFSENVNQLTFNRDTEGGYTGFYIINNDSGAISGQYFSYNLDTNPPKITISHPNLDEWTNKDVEITIQAYDNDAETGYGLHSYSLDGGVTWIDIPREILDDGTITLPRNYTFTHTLEENQTLNIWVKDHVGHITKETFECSNIDQVAPTGTFILKNGENNEATWNKFIEPTDISFDIYKSTDISFQIQAQDTLSELAWVGFYTSDKAMTKAELDALDSNNWSNNQIINSSNLTKDFTFDIGKDSEQMIIYVKIVDNVGNVTYLNSNGITFDTTDPKVEATANTTDLTNQDVTITLEITETGSGIASVTDNTTTWTVDSKDPNKYTTTVSINGTYYYTVTDKAGNVTQGSYVVSKIDKTLPTITVNTTAKTEWHNGTEIINFTTSDANGIESIIVTCDTDSSFSDYTSEYFTASANGVYTITVTDNAGNVATSEVTISKIDTTSPIIEKVEFSTSDFTNGNVTLTVTAQDIGSGVALYSFDGGNTWQTSNSKSFDTNQTVSIKVKDTVGNISEVNTSAINKIDTIAPTGSITIDKNTWDKFLESITFGIYKSSNLEVSISSNDNSSGIKSAEYLTVESAKTLEELQAESSWSEYKAFTISAVDNLNVIVYAKITDNAENVTYLSSNGIIFDTTAPVISGVSNNSFYSQSLNIEVADANLETVTLNGENVEPKFEIAQGTEQTYTLVATDIVGNVTSYVFYTYVNDVPVEDILNNLPTIDNNTSDEEKEQIKDTISNLTDKYLEELKESTDKDEDTIINELNKLEDALVKVNSNISVVGKDKVVAENIANDKKAPTVEITPQGLLVAIHGSNTHKNNIGSNMELSLSITQLSGDENSLVFDIKPMVSVNGNKATIIPNSDLNSPITFKLYLNNSFRGSIAMVKHIKENGSTATYNNVPVKQDNLGKYLNITVHEFSKFIVSEYSYNVSVDETSSSHKVTDKVTLTTPTKEGYKFTGWESDDVTIANSSFIMPEKAVVITSTWEKIPDEDTDKDDTTKPDTSNPDTSKPDDDKDDTTNPDTSKPDEDKDDTTNPDTSNPDEHEDKDDTTKPEIDDSTAQTGDSSNNILWLVLLGLSLIGVYSTIKLIQLRIKN